MRAAHRQLTADELDALKAFAIRHGRTWKQALRDAWMTAGEPGILQQLRNDTSFGPQGLNALKLK